MDRLSRIRTLSTLVAGLCALVLTCARAQESEHQVGIADQRALTLTVYNGGIALIHDRRRVHVVDGERIAWRDVSAQLQPETAILETLSGPKVNVVEQNFNYDVMTPAAFLAKSVGHEVTIDHISARDGRPRLERAKILSVTDGIVLQYADRIETQLDGVIRYASIPPELRDRPTLTLDLEAPVSGESDLDLSYLSNGLGWSADYVGRVSLDDRKLDLTGFVTMNNTTGTSFRKAKLLLVAGNVNVPGPRAALGAVYSVAANRAEAQQQFSQQNFFDYHLYTLRRPVTVNTSQTKQITLISARGIPLFKSYELRGSAGYYEQQTPDLGERVKVGVFLTFENRGGELGIPLPAGIVRLYKTESSGSSIFLGGDNIDHTPKNESVRLHVGDAFDVTAHRKQVSFRYVSGDKRYESSYEILLRNAKSEAVNVEVIEPIPGDWTITASNFERRKSSSSTATWTVRVPPDGSSTLTYTVVVRP